MSPIDRRRDIADIASTARSLDPLPSSSPPSRRDVALPSSSPPSRRDVAPGRAPRAGDRAGDRGGAPEGASRAGVRRGGAPEGSARAGDRAKAHAVVAFAMRAGDLRAVAGNAASAPSGAITSASAAHAPRAVQARLDAVRVAASGPYRVPGTVGLVFAPSQFRMNGGYNQRASDARGGELAAVCRGKVPAYEIQFARWGRASPSALVRITQALIDAGKLPGPQAGSLVDRIRSMQWAYGVGFDCAGYVQQALLAVRGLSGSVSDRASIGLAPAVGNEGFVDMSAAEKRAKFRSVSIASAMPGAIAKLKPPVAAAARGEPGHVVIVYSNRADPEALKGAMDHFAAKGGSALADAARFAGRGRVRAIEVDSSWGAEDGKPFGGVRRDVWLHDDATGAWGYYTPHGAAGFRVALDGPCGEVFGGAFEAR